MQLKGKRPSHASLATITEDTDRETSTTRYSSNERTPLSKVKFPPFPNLAAVHEESDSNSVRSSSVKPLQLKPRCAFCKSDHWSSACGRYKTIKARTERAMELRLCLKCLKEGHIAKQCKGRRSCYHCQKPHHQALCGKGEAPPTNFSSKPQSGPVSAGTVMSLSTNKQELVLLECVQIVISNPVTKRKVQAIAFLDSGSSISLITNNVVEVLGLSPNKIEKLALWRVNDELPSPFVSQTVTLNLILNDGTELPLTLKSVDRLPTLMMAKNPGQIRLGSSLSVRSHKPDLLVGMDYLNQLEVQRDAILKSGFTLKTSKLGPLISGKGMVSCPTISVNRMEVDLLSAVNEFLSAEKTGIGKVGVNLDEMAWTDLKKNIKFLNGRYEVDLPLIKSKLPQLPTNFGLAFGRLKSNLARLRRNPELLKRYDDDMKSQLAAGILELVPYPQRPTANQVHYLPQQYVLKKIIRRNFERFMMGQPLLPQIPFH